MPMHWVYRYRSLLCNWRSGGTRFGRASFKGSAVKGGPPSHTAFFVMAIVYVSRHPFSELFGHSPFPTRDSHAIPVHNPISFVACDIMYQ